MTDTEWKKEELEVMHFLVATLNGHSVTIVRDAGTPDAKRLLGFSVGRNRTLAVRDLLDAINGPDDGRPCTMDKFAAALQDDCDDPFDRWEAIVEWLHGDWDAALSYLEDETRARIAPDED